MYLYAQISVTLEETNGAILHYALQSCCGYSRYRPRNAVRKNEDNINALCMQKRAWSPIETL